MWCDTVGCVSPSGSVRLQTHTGSLLVARRLTIFTRCGSASAWKSSAVASASSSESAAVSSGAQQAMGDVSTMVYI